MPGLLSSQLQALLGVHDYLTFNSVPAGSGIGVGSRITGVALPNGVYTCSISLAGLTAKLAILLKAAFGAGSVTTSGGTTMLDGSTVITNFTGVAAMATTVRQTLNLGSMNGERFALLTITVAGGGNPVFSEGEYYGN